MMRQVITALSVSLLLAGFAPIAKAQSPASQPQSGGAAALEGVEPRSVQTDFGNDAEVTVPATSIQETDLESVTRTYPVEELGNDADLALQSENYIPPTQESDPAIQRDNLQIQVQTGL